MPQNILELTHHSSLTLNTTANFLITRALELC